MRRGKLLAEDTPSRLMQQHSCDTLELVFLQLSRVQSLQECETPDSAFGVNKALCIPDPSTVAPQYLENHTTEQVRMPGQCRIKCHFLCQLNTSAYWLCGFETKKMCIVIQ
jgi:hypothetical protein